MSKNIVLDVENVSKQYRLGEVGTGSLQHDIKRWWANVRGQEDPFLKIGETNDRTQKGDSDYVWALKDINFQVEQGQAVGIIGRNGAGKSTLLKLLSRVTKPTTGSIKYKGRIASLLEVGTGFHPEMTGRENIYLNGAILGMTRKEITRKFDEIVAFAGVERYIDTPVKRYSSGMYVRLAFAVAAHLESEILIVDEVLAVGDAEFQKKCLGKMGDVTKGEGRTILFVSHNMAAVKQLCNYSLVLENGSIDFIGTVNDAVNKYNSNTIKNKEYSYKSKNDRNITKVEEIYISTERGIRVTVIDSLLEAYYLNVSFNVIESYGLNFGATIFNINGEPLMSLPVFNDFLNSTKQYIKIKLPIESLIAGEYYLQGALWVNNVGEIENNDSYLMMKIDPRHQLELIGGTVKGMLIVNSKWEK
ncbi:ABC transporter ATP-binding protein [Empedobacter falsenii]